MDALILAGKKDNGALESQQNLTNKALLMLNDITMIEYVVNALNQSKEVNRIVVVGPKAELTSQIAERVSVIIDSTESIIENIQIGVNCINEEKLMVLTSDIPLITGAIVDRFIIQCQHHDALLCYPYITKEKILEKYPKAIRSYATLKEGTFCGGNVIIFHKQIFDKNKSLLDDLYQKRKDVKKYIALLGIRFIIKYLLKTLTVKEIEDRACEIIGYTVKGIRIDDPEIMIDLDKLSDYELIRQALQKVS